MDESERVLAEVKRLRDLVAAEIERVFGYKIESIARQFYEHDVSFFPPKPSGCELRIELQWGRHGATGNVKIVVASPLKPRRVYYKGRLGDGQHGDPNYKAAVAKLKERYDLHVEALRAEHVRTKAQEENDRLQAEGLKGVELPVYINMKRNGNDGTWSVLADLRFSAYGETFENALAFARVLQVADQKLRDQQLDGVKE